ncbi:MAG TPA: hypothetical protein VNV62_14590 [Trebonia sp.]|jgi:hypothetical protein|nr:hypothetical protein [Trebonia sp.]
MHSLVVGRPHVSRRQTRCDVAPAAAVGSELSVPAAGQIRELLLAPPTPAQVIEDGERRVFRTRASPAIARP